MLIHRYGVEETYARTCGVCCLNFWVPIERPAYDVPLCLLDCSSIADLETNRVGTRSFGDLRFSDGAWWTP